MTDTGQQPERVEVTQTVRSWSCDGTVADAIARLYAAGSGNTARSLEVAIYGLTTVDIVALAKRVFPSLPAARVHWERGFRAARGDEAAKAGLVGSQAEEAGERDAGRWLVGFDVGRGCGRACAARSFTAAEAAGIAAGQSFRRMQ